MKTALVLISLLTSLNASAAVYTWKDASGVTHFSQIPNSYDSKAINVHVINVIEPRTQATDETSTISNENISNNNHTYATTECQQLADSLNKLKIKTQQDPSQLAFYREQQRVLEQECASESLQLTAAH